MNMRIEYRLALLIILAALLAAKSPIAAADDSASAEVPASADVAASKVDATKVTYDTDVLPILRQHCLNCHHAGDARGGLAMDTYSALLEGGGSGEVVFDDGDADSSRLWQLVNHDDTPVMPPSKVKLADSELKLIRAWIEGGVFENDGSIAKPKQKNALAAIAISVGRPEGGGVMPGDSVPMHVPVLSSRPGAVSAIATSPWAPLVAIGGQRQVVLYRTDNHELVGILPLPEGLPHSIRFSVSGSHLIVGAGTHSVRGITAVFDVASGQRLASVGDELDIVFDADANASLDRIAMGGPQKRLRIYDATDGTMLHDIDKHTDWIYAVAYSPDGKWIASGDRSGGLYLWEADTGRLSLDLAGHSGAIRSVAWRDDSTVLASASEDGTAGLWNAIDGKLIKQVKVSGEPATSIDFDHAGGFVVGSADNHARWFDAKGGEKLKLPKMSDDVLEVAISHDGSRIIYGDWTGEIWSVSVTDPADKHRLASNPASLAERIVATESELAKRRKELADRREEFAKLKSDFEAAKAKLESAEKSHEKANQVHQRLSSISAQ